MNRSRRERSGRMRLNREIIVIGAGGRSVVTFVGHERKEGKKMRLRKGGRSDLEISVKRGKVII